MEYKDLTPEQMEKARECKTKDELVALAKEEGVELTEEQLEAVSGGSWSGDPSDCDALTCESKDCSCFSCDSVDCRGLDCTIYD